MHNRKCQGPFRSACSLVLGSGSPRRKALLERLGLSFTVCIVEAEELDGTSGLSPEELTMENAMRKLSGAKKVCSADAVICADTCVYCEGKILGKPSSFDEAFSMLKFLNRKWHEVYTSFAALRVSSGQLKRKTVSSRVFIDVINEDILYAYCSSSEPYDKAGGYAVQGRGSFLTKRIDGSYTNVVGLPITETVETLLELGIIEPCVTDMKR